MFDLQLYDVAVGFVGALVLVNIFPSLSKVGAGIISGARRAWNYVSTKIRGGR